MTAGRDTPRKVESPHGGGLPEGYSKRNQRTASVRRSEPAKELTLPGVGTTLYEALCAAWGPPERRIGGRLSWPCRLPGHRGYQVLTIGDDPRASIWTCLGRCGTGDVYDFQRLMSP